MNIEISALYNGYIGSANAYRASKAKYAVSRDPSKGS
jgi:hypothetical protein